MPKHYSIANYDRNLCLKPNSTMWLILLYLFNPYVVLILSIVNKKDRTELIDMFYPDRLMMSLGALAGIPAVMVIYAWTKRKPEGSDLVKAVWSRGRGLLVISAFLNICVAFIPVLIGMVYRVPTIAWIQIAVATLIIIVLFTSSYIRDCFNDFPAEADSTRE